VQFDFDSDRITNEGKRDLDEFGEAILKMNNTSVLLEGHTDAMGTDEYNMSLSQRRAEAARRYLLESFGFPDARIVAVGKGKTTPLAPNDNEANMKKNRRVDFVFSAANATP
jgi:outer membrane protein OmpA-like peptidoglycan-associated protein